jgi:subtilisin family serine protease
MPSVLRVSLVSLLLLVSSVVVAAEKRYLVEFRGAPSHAHFESFRRDAAAASGMAGKRAVEIVPRHEFSRLFHGVSVTLDTGAAREIRKLPYVAAVRLDREMTLFGTDVAHLERIGVKEVWTTLGARGEGITIAVIDSGVDRRHFGDRYIGGYDFVERDDDPDDPHGHGTHVAGIALGDGSDFSGVAPAAKLLAYRVMDANGRGFGSDVIAALERALDPNGDGDPSDRADVVNLSLGSTFGDADDPEAIAVDRAVQAGMVVALAAGNFGGAQSIGSPATSRLGITVGNSDANDVLAFDSSYGPAAPDYQVKPDVTAPGEQIRSAKSGGGSIVFSGTSMAAPHVAGAAALLLELHPRWTPQEVKAALIGSAQVINDEVMTQGGGRIDVARAATMPAMAFPSSLAFGRTTEARWTETRVTRVTNVADAAQTFTAMAEAMAPGVSVVVEPAAFTLAAGEARDVTVTLRLTDPGPVSRRTLTFGGRVSFASERGTFRVPWIVVNAALVTVDNPDYATVMWSCDGFGNRDGHGPALLPAGRCTALAQFDAGNAEQSALVVVSRDVRDDEKVSVRRDMATHRLVAAGVDEGGRPLSGRRAVFYRVDFGAAHMPRYVDAASRVLEVSDLPDDVTVTAVEASADFAGGRVAGVQHAPIHGVRGDHTFINSVSAFRSVQVRVLPSAGELRLGLRGELGVVTAAAETHDLSRGWSGQAFLAMGDVAGVSLITPSFLSAPLGGDDVTLGEGPSFPRIDLLTRETRFGFSHEFVGPQLERRWERSTWYEARDASGALLAKGTPEPFTIVEGSGDVTLTLGANGAGTTTFSFDTRREDFTPPVLRSARFADGALLLAAEGAALMRAFSRTAGGEWTPLPLTGSRVEVPSTAAEVRLQLEDAAGNGTTWSVAVPGEGVRRRSVRK